MPELIALHRQNARTAGSSGVGKYGDDCDNALLTMAEENELVQHPLFIVNTHLKGNSFLTLASVSQRSILLQIIYLFQIQSKMNLE